MPADQGGAAESDPERILAWSESVANGDTLALPKLALWLPKGVKAALGLSQKPEKELVLDPDGGFAAGVVRRQSGGGAVLLYPGVMCWEALAPCAMVDAVHGSNSGIRQAYDFLSAPVVGGLRKLGIAAFRAGISDLSVESDGIVRKIAGTAQYRRRGNILVHGALLVSADVDLMSTYLAFPSAQPEYRADRSHRDFCVSLAELSGDGDNRAGLMAAALASIRAAASETGWELAEPPERLEGEARQLEEDKYRDPDWNWRKIRK